MAVWIGVFGGEIKEMLSRLNEGRFTRYNEGWTHVFMVDAYLKGLANTVPEQKVLSADIHSPCHQQTHRRPRTIFSITFILCKFFSVFFSSFFYLKEIAGLNQSLTLVFIFSLPS